MSRRRKLSTTISLDKDVNRLARDAGDFAALLYTWMIPHAEDSASITGNVEELMLTVVPGFRHHTEADIEAAVEAMDRIGLVAWDHDDALIYFDSESFYRHQSYIPEAKRADNSAHFQKRRESAKRSEEQRESAKKAASLSPSPSLSPEDLNPLAGKPAGEVAYNVDVAFEDWWVAYGRVGDKARARDLFRWWITTGKAPPGELFAAAANYRAHCERTDTKIKHAATFLAKPGKGKSAIWPEWAAGEEHGSMDTRSDTRLNDVLTAGAQAFGLTTGAHHGRTHDIDHDLGERPDRACAGGAPARRGLPAGSVARRE